MAIKPVTNPNAQEKSEINRGLQRSIRSEKGNAKVTSRPGQHGIVNAVMLED